MRRQFRRAHGALAVKGSKAQASLLQRPLVRRIKPIIAVIPFCGFVRPVSRPQAAAGDQSHRTGLFHQRASQSCDKQNLRVRSGFGMIGAGESGNVSPKFNQGMLKAAAGAQKRTPLLARPANRLQHAGHIHVRTAGRHPDSGAISKVVIRDAQGPGFNPSPRNVAPARHPRQFQSFGNRKMRRLVGRIVANQSDNERSHFDSRIATASQEGKCRKGTF